MPSSAHTPPLPPHTPPLPSPALKCTSHLWSKGISPKILPFELLKRTMLDSDYPPINMPRLSSYNIKCLRQSIQPIRGAAATKNAECIVLHCLHRHRLAWIIGVFMLGTGVIADWLRCSCVFLLSGSMSRIIPPVCFGGESGLADISQKPRMWFLKLSSSVCFIFCVVYCKYMKLSNYLV